MIEALKPSNVDLVQSLRPSIRVVIACEKFAGSRSVCRRLRRLSPDVSDENSEDDERRLFLRDRDLDLPLSGA